MPAVGARVHNAVAGEGRVIRLDNGGRDWVVEFDSRPRVPYRLKPHHLTVLSVPQAATARPAQAPAKAPPPPRLPAAPAARAHTPEVVKLPAPTMASLRSRRATADMNPHDRRQCLEALRMGVVPAGGLDRITVGRDAELSALDALFSARSGLLVFSGGYGTGKTHLIEVGESRARESKMLVARATFDGEELPPSHPIRLYRELVASIAYPDDPRTGLAPLFDRLVDKLGAEAAAKLPPNRWLTPALWARTHCADPDLVGDAIAWASGEPVWLDDLRADLERRGWRGPSLLALPDYRTFGQIMAHLLGAVAVWAREAGYGGLSVLLDEAEYIDKLGATSREMAENVLRYLAVATLPSRQLGFDPERMYRGGQQVHRAVPTRFADDQPLVALFAFTPNPEVDRVIAGISVGGSAVRPLDAIGRAHLGALVEAVVDLVCAAHPGVEVGNVDRDNLRRAALKAHDEGLVENTRDVAKMAVYWMDLHRHDPLRARRALR